ncbi:unnamed protein product, partial [marine sediment metagenome]
RDKAACRETNMEVLAKILEKNVVMGGINIESDTDSVKSGGEKEMADKKKEETKKAKETKEPEKKVEKKEPEKKVGSKKKTEDMTLEELQSSLLKDSISAEERNHVIDAIVQKKVDKILADKALYNERRATLTEFTDEELANVNILRDEIFDRFSKDNQIKVLQKTVEDHEYKMRDIVYLQQRINELQQEKENKSTDKGLGKVETGAEKKEEKKTPEKTDVKPTEKKEEKKAEKKEKKPAEKKEPEKKAADKVEVKKDDKNTKKDKAADTDAGGKD